MLRNGNRKTWETQRYECVCGDWFYVRPTHTIFFIVVNIYLATNSLRGLPRLQIYSGQLLKKMIEFLCKSMPTQYIEVNCLLRW